MSLNCLSCQILQRTDSERHRDQQIQTYYASDEFDSSERSWSGNLSFRPHDRHNRGGFRGLPENKVAPISHRRAVSFGGKEPRLVRSSGMRRDWSFEDLRTIREEREPSAIHFLTTLTFFFLFFFFFKKTCLYIYIYIYIFNFRMELFIYNIYI
ncbi:uncharacterized protein LOC120091761 [Benincasa hispida]|uniref:uncharacterized protein LOC120091761 n=1 Tax=Benincasa hispida TaxID=102211 RepID=UPI0019019D7C|nr:uncharacterized protein LOC120091761 [Benincasa hispida]